MAPLDATASASDALTGLDPLSCAGFLLLAFTLAGAVQTAWFAADRSRALAIPLDGGLTLRGRRLFGANKTVRGFVVMVPAASVSFAALAAAIDPAAYGLWPLATGGYAALGAWAALGFMAGELPNSFIKRQLGIPPGAGAITRPGLALQVLFDRVDSGVGMLAAVALAVPTPWTTWATVLLIGPFIHWCFSLTMFRLGIKQRAA
ncbi:MAG TPA: CDP-archaeol synthase [Vicinamibacterales bacterium]|nr:CDP-archaeol synthase [Vicinamibacterales bacterium]